MNLSINKFSHLLYLLPLIGISGISHSQEPTHDWIIETTYIQLIHDGLPPYQFRFTEDTVDSIDNRIVITRNNDTTSQQVLKDISIEPYLPAWSKKIEFVDMNFDGYLDIKLISWMGATGNTGYHFWLFDKKTGQFKYHTELSKLSNPESDPDTRLIFSHSRGGMVGQIYTTQSHVFIQDILVLVREEKQDWVDDKKCLQRVVQERIKDKMTTVSEGVTFEDEVKRGDKYYFEFTDKMTFGLDPIDYGWEIMIRMKDRPDENLARLTPPFHFVPNPRHIEGWHFRNADNTGPNDGSVNAPRDVRDFIFSPKVGLTIQGQDSSSIISEEEVNAVEKDGKGTLMITEYQLDNLLPKQKANFKSMKFRVELEYRSTEILKDK